MKDKVSKSCKDSKGGQNMDTRRFLFVMYLLLAVDALFWGVDQGCAQSQATVQSSQSDGSALVAQGTLRSMTLAQRQAAADRAAVAQRGERALQLAAPTPGGTPDYFGIYPNYANSPLIRKFVDTLPGLGSANANNLGHYIPIAISDTTTYPGSDYYQIGLVDYTQQMNSDLPVSRLRGYKDLASAADGKAHYLGPLIIAKRDRPVRLKFTNMLGLGTAGNLFLPVDTTVMGAGAGPLDDAGNPCDPMVATCASYTQNRAVIHLHGGATPWISDGTPHQWITPAGETTPFLKGVSQQNVPDMPDPGDGSATYYYSNQQSSRLMFYHDHTYGMTRLNVYAGEAAGYLLTDAVEEYLINTKVIPDLGGVYHYGIPLIIQDKTFVDATRIASQDPTWNWGTTRPTPNTGDLWFPHVYMPNQNPNDVEGANAMGRWDYGPWFWPVFNMLAHLPIIGDGTNGCPAGLTCPATPNPSLVPEAFLDTPVVNGTAYPVLKVERKAYRFRILNASNDRFLNLQLYYADKKTEVKMVPASYNKKYPSTWPTDGRAGGVPDPKKAGPQMIQIGTESGFLPAPVVLPNTPIGYEYNRRDVTVLNVSNHTFLLGPAERADIIIDFSKVKNGAKLILYNDAPAPVPGFDPRNDYYTGNPDLTSTGGAPTTGVGYGPNTRTIMQFQVKGKKSPAFDLAALEAAFASTVNSQGAFATAQDPIIVPQAGYNSAYNATYPADNSAYARIQDTSMTFTPISGTPITIQMQPKAIQELFELNYGRMNATLGVELPFTNSGNQTTIPYGYIDPPSEIIHASAAPGPPVAGDGTQIWKITHNGVDTHAMHFHLFNVQLINRVGWDGMVKPPDANELGWKETVRMNPLEDAIVALRPTAPRLPFSVPESVRLLDPTNQEGSTFASLDPLTGARITVTNELTNFGWEYVWHCHLLGHEENDMMRPLIMTNITNYVTPVAAPYDLNAVAGAQQIALAWTDNSSNETGFRIERAIGAGAFASVGTVSPTVSIYIDTTVQPTTTYTYRVFAFDGTGDSLPSNTATVTSQ
jgi:FtsP/CotA-like multicopper oxidase with cupredoxin domain